MLKSTTLFRFPLQLKYCGHNIVIALTLAIHSFTNTMFENCDLFTFIPPFLYFKTIIHQKKELYRTMPQRMSLKTQTKGHFHQKSIKYSLFEPLKSYIW